jgi:transposase
MSLAPLRKPYPSDVSDEEWSLVVGYLTLMKEDAPHREYALRELFNALRYVIRYGIACGPCRTTFHRGTRCINRPTVGWQRDVLRLWRRICALSCAWQRGVERSRRRRL